MHSIQTSFKKSIDYIPFVSTCTSLVYLFTRYVNDTTPPVEEHSYTILGPNSPLRRVTLLVPILGNIVIGVYDYVNTQVVNKPLTSEQLTPEQLASKQLRDHLQGWVEAEGGHAAEAAAKILQAYSEKATCLTLVGLNLKSLPPEIGDLSELQALNLQGNQLTNIPPELGNLSKLQRLYLQNNKLTDIPSDLGNLSELQELHLSKNQLISIPPELGNLSKLQILYLQNNKLTNIPLQLGNLLELQELKLSQNQLTSIPSEIGDLSELQTLNLDHNENLRDLPTSLQTLLHLTRIDIEGTQISQDVVNAIMQFISGYRVDHAAADLPAHLQIWIAASGQRGLSIPLESFSEREKLIIQEWLVRLGRTNDFRGNQQRLAWAVCEILGTCVRDGAKCETLLSQMKVNNEVNTCEDRAGMAFNELYTAWKLLTLPENASLQEKLQCLISGAKTLALRKVLAEKIAAYGKKMNRAWSESVECYLKYESELKDRLGLLSFIQDPHYATDVGKLEGVTHEALIEEVNNSYMDELFQLSGFQNLAKEDEDVQGELSKKEQASLGQIDALDPHSMQDAVYKQRCDDLKRQYEDEKTAIFRQWLSEHS